MDFDSIVKAFADFLRQQSMGQPFQGLNVPQQEAPEATMAETAATPSMLSQTFGMQSPPSSLFGNGNGMIGAAKPAPTAVAPMTNAAAQGQQPTEAMGDQQMQQALLGIRRGFRIF